MKDHCHITGEFRGAAHSSCNKKLRLNVKTFAIPVVFHNLQGYDAHLLMQEMGCTDKKRELSCIAKNMEKYISFNYGGLKFIDSFAFLNEGLGVLVENTIKGEKRPEEELRKTAELAKYLGRPFEPLVKKGTYPYEYVDNFEKFKETALPPQDCFFSTLADRGIDEKEWTHGQEVWKSFGCQNLGDYHDVYMQTDVAQVADVFENFRELCLRQYGLDPAHYLTAPGLAWDALLKKSGAELELLTDYDLHLFI